MNENDQEVQEIIVENKEILLTITIEHDGGVFLYDVPENIRSADSFICRVKCNDGAIIDFYAPNAQIAAHFPNEFKSFPFFFIEDMVEMIGDPEPFVAVIKGQAYIESIVTTIISGILAEPSALELNRMPFWQKVDLCIATGAIHSDAGRALKHFANIRNDFAHKVWPTYTEKSFRDFLNVVRQSQHLSKRLKQFNLNEHSMFNCISAMWFYLLEQSFRIANNRGSLIAFWKHVADIDNPLPYNIEPFPAKKI